MRKTVLISCLVVATLVGPLVAQAQAAGATAVTPNANLVSGQTVNVSGTGWPASTTLDVQQCAVFGINDFYCQPSVQVTTDGSGSFSTTYVVQRFISAQDCNRAGLCIMIVGSQALDYTFTNLTFISETARPDLVLRRRSDGALLFDNTYTSAPTPYRHSIAPGGAWVFATVLQNDGAAAGDLTVTATSVPAPFSVRYFFGYYDITSYITGPGITFHGVAPGRSYGIGVKFSADPATPAGATADITMTAISVTEPGLNDALKLGVKAPSP